MTVPLEPPLTRGAPWGCYDWGEPLTVGPRYVRSAGASRWHRPRSGVRKSDGRIRYDQWCGPYVRGDEGFREADQVPDGDPVCGTCEGRAIGAGQDTWPDTTRTLVFTPNRLVPPKKCPGSRTEWCAELAWNVGRCLVCGVVTPMRSSGGPYNSRWGMTNHPPGPDLVDGCPFHAWRELHLVDGRVECRCKRGGDATRTT